METSVLRETLKKFTVVALFENDQITGLKYYVNNFPISSIGNDIYLILSYLILKHQRTVSYTKQQKYKVRLHHLSRKIFSKEI